MVIKLLENRAGTRMMNHASVKSMITRYTARLVPEKFYIIVSIPIFGQGEHPTWYTLGHEADMQDTRQTYLAIL